MGLASEQDVQNKPVVREPWTFGSLFPLRGAVVTLGKTFTNPFDALLGFLVLVVSIAELIGRDVSWFMWVFVALILATTVWERNKPQVDKPKGKAGKRK